MTIRKPPLLVQVQGVFAEYERAKIAERNRRGRLFRARAGEIVYRLVPFGYRRMPRGSAGPSHLQIFEPEAVTVRRIFDDFAAGGYSMRRICRRLYEDGIPSPTGKTGVVDRVHQRDAQESNLQWARAGQPSPIYAVDNGSEKPAHSAPTASGVDRDPRAGDHWRGSL